MRSKAIAGIAAVVVALLLTACGEDAVTLPEETQPASAPEPAEPEPVEPEPVEPEAPEMTERELDIEIFEYVAESTVTPLMDRETCALVDLLGPQPFVDAFREGFEVDGHWWPEYDGIVKGIIAGAC